MFDPVIVSAVRTAVARENGALRDLPVEVPGISIDRQCASGVQAICLAGQAIKAGDAAILVAGGSDSLTRAPYLMAGPPAAYSRTPPQFVRFQLAPDAIGNPPMGITAENVAERYQITREEQDAFALRSQHYAARAITQGRFAGQIVPVELPKGGRFEVDEHPRPDTTLERQALCNQLGDRLARPHRFIHGDWPTGRQANQGGQDQQNRPPDSTGTTPSAPGWAA